MQETAENTQTQTTQKITANKKTLERLETARGAAEKMGRTFVASIFRTIIKQEKVKISLPKIGAKYLKFVEAHKLLVFEGTALKSVALVDVHAHYTHGDFPVRNDEGKLRPSVIRHLFVHPTFLGEDIVANVEIKEKTSLLNGDKAIIIDIVQVFSDGTPVETEHTLRLGAPITGVKGEVVISNTERCVLIEKIAPTKVINDLEAILKDDDKKRRLEEKRKDRRNLVERVEAALANMS